MSASRCVPVSKSFPRVDASSIQARLKRLCEAYFSFKYPRSLSIPAVVSAAWLVQQPRGRGDGGYREAARVFEGKVRLAKPLQSGLDAAGIDSWEGLTDGNAARSAHNRASGPAARRWGMGTGSARRLAME